MKNFDEIIFNDNFKDIIYNESDFRYLFNLEKYIEERISSFNDRSFSPDTSEREKILVAYGKGKQIKLNMLKQNLRILKERLNYLQALNSIDTKQFLLTLNEDKLSKLSESDIIFIAQKLDQKSLYSFIDKIEMLKTPYLFKKDCPKFLEKDLKVLREIRDSKFPKTVFLPPRVQEILDSGIFDSKSDDSQER